MKAFIGRTGYDMKFKKRGLFQARSPSLRGRQGSETDYLTNTDQEIPGRLV